jgi:hypothetical protein
MRCTIQGWFPADLSAARRIADNIRPADRAEIEAIKGEGADVYATIAEGLLMSDPALVGLVDGVPAAAMGVAPCPGAPGFGIVWLLGTPALEAAKFEFLRLGRPTLEALQRGYSHVGNVIDERNLLHRKWLAWLGFSFVGRIPEYGAQRRPFLEFMKRAA